MLQDGLRPILGILVILAPERPTNSSLPARLHPDWEHRALGSPTFQEHDSIDDFDWAHLPEGVFNADGFPERRDARVVEIWGSEATPPRAYDGVRVHGSIAVKAFFIPPSKFGSVLDKCHWAKARTKWAEDRFVFTVRLHTVRCLYC